MLQPEGEAQSDALRLDFDRRLKLEFHGSSVTSDAELLAYRELDAALGLMAIAGQHLVDRRTGRNGRPDLVGTLRQSVFGRLAGYEDVNDADRLGRDPAMRWIVGGRAVERDVAWTSHMGRFETEWLAGGENLAALTGLSAQWIDRVHDRRSLRAIVLDMDSSVSPTYGDQEGTPYNGHFACSCYHPLFVSSSATSNGARCDRATSIRQTAGRACSNRSWPGTGTTNSGATSAPMQPLPTPMSTSSWRPKVTGTRSACRRTVSSRSASVTSSSALLAARRARSGDTTPASAIRRQSGRCHGQG